MRLMTRELSFSSVKMRHSSANTVVRTCTCRHLPVDTTVHIAGHRPLRRSREHDVRVQLQISLRLQNRQTTAHQLTLCDGTDKTITQRVRGWTVVQFTDIC